MQLRQLLPWISEPPKAEKSYSEKVAATFSGQWSQSRKVGSYVVVLENSKPTSFREAEEIETTLSVYRQGDVNDAFTPRLTFTFYGSCSMEQNLAALQEHVEHHAHLHLDHDIRVRRPQDEPQKIGGTTLIVDGLQWG